MFTHDDMLKAFEKWRNLDRTGRLGPEHDDEIKLAWKYYCKIRDYIADNQGPKPLEIKDLQAFDLE